MKNHIQKGDVITVAAPAGGVASGEGAIIGNIFGIAAYAAAVGEPLELATTGVYQLPKATTAVLTVGARGMGQYGEEHQRDGHRALPCRHRDRGGRERHHQCRRAAGWNCDGGSVNRNAVQVFVFGRCFPT